MVVFDDPGWQLRPCPEGMDPLSREMSSGSAGGGACIGVSGSLRIFPVTTAGARVGCSIEQFLTARAGLELEADDRGCDTRSGEGYKYQSDDSKHHPQGCRVHVTSLRGIQFIGLLPVNLRRHGIRLGGG